MKIQVFVDDKEVDLAPIFLDLIEDAAERAERYAKRQAREAKAAESR